MSEYHISQRQPLPAPLQRLLHRNTLQEHIAYMPHHLRTEGLYAIQSQLLGMESQLSPARSCCAIASPLAEWLWRRIPAEASLPENKWSAVLLNEIFKLLQL